MNKFIGRIAELKLLEKAYLSRKSEFIPIYGRRRLGKSKLILEFIKNKTSIYYLGKKAPERFQIKEFLQDASIILKEPLLASISADNWKIAIEYVVNKWEKKEKLILVFDEFQWTAEVSKELPSILQEFWDMQWSSTNNIMLILCGSYIGFMEREVLGRKSPLFGRRTAQIQLKPFNYLEASDFHPHFSVIDKAKTYFICGGVPQYLQYFSESLSVEQNIIQSVLSEFSPLFYEPDFLLREELRDIENYYAVLLSIAEGFKTNKLISRKTQIGERALYYYLKQLIELGYLSKHYPVSENKPVNRNVRYEINDPLLGFWFRYIYPNQSYILQMGAERAMQDLIKNNLESYFGHCFEKLSREALLNFYIKEGVISSFEIGEYWDKNTQIAVVGLRKDNWIDIGECKWTKVNSIKGLLEELKHKIHKFPNSHNATIGLRIFTRDKTAAHKSGQKNLKFHSLESIYTI